MAVGAHQGLNRVREIYQDRPQRARRLNTEGNKVVGYLCIYSTVEIMTALDLVPYRIFGDMRETITKADAHMPTTVCPFLRSCLDLGLKGKYDFLDGIIVAHACDVTHRIPSLWGTLVRTPFSHFMDVPHTVHEGALEKQKGLLKHLHKSLESLAGKELSPSRLKEAIEAHNRQRALVRELYDLRKPDPPLISGTETLQVVVALMSLPVEEGSELLREVISEVKERKDGPTKKAARLLTWGSIIDDTAIIEMIESLDANVVMDDNCVGSRAYFADVKLTDDPLDGLAYRYLAELKCPRTFREDALGRAGKDYIASLENRYSYLGGYARDWRVGGALLQSVRYCDTHGYEVPSVKDYLASTGLPSIYLEHDYSEGALAPLRTRVQGFLEVIG